jgi:hypothetical protein
LIILIILGEEYLLAGQNKRTQTSMS